ncbi:hypothetical protein BpHYR1_006775 [Brachionus plicatilis]|uniref:Uncharacterized protein n=1 Tax=Brachionus plicatilis TaxID=10195 RepID=A0A3M7SYN2_BRAPC|nr:hypothetical protein BpHYR1_006775 [Brachionus plicatilis]
MGESGWGHGKSRLGMERSLARAIVEGVGGKGAESGMHAVLDLESNGPYAEADKALEQRLAEARARRLLAHDHGAQLTVVADQYELAGAQHHWHHALGLGRLRALRQKADRRVDGLAALGAQTHHLEASAVYFFGELVDSDVAGRAHQHLTVALLGQVVDDGGRGDRLAGARRTLDQAEVPLQHCFDRVDLRVVELGQTGHREASGQVGLDDHVLDFVAEQLVIDERRYRVFVDGKRFERALHPVERRRLPHKLDYEPELVAGHQPHFVVGLGQAEVGEPLFVQAQVPADLDVALGLRLFEASVVVGLHFDERRKYVLVLRRRTCCGSSSTPGRSKSSNLASGASFHSSSSLFICWAVIWRARNCSCSDGILTSHDKNERSSINGFHSVGSQFKSLREVWVAHGCRHSRTTTESDLAGM